MKEAENHYKRLEEKLLEADKEKQDLEEQSKRAVDSLEEQVCIIKYVCFQSKCTNTLFLLFSIVQLKSYFFFIDKRYKEKPQHCPN